MASHDNGYLEGHLLIATPLIEGPSFSKAVVFVAAHSEEGAMGIIVNHILENIGYGELFDQLNLPASEMKSELPVHFGGPVEINRGFVIYGDDGVSREDTILTVKSIAISASVNILREIAAGGGPEQRLLALGYAGWTAGQLEQEMEEGSWISIPVSSDILFHTPNDLKWERASQLAGVDMRKFSSHVGHA